MKEIDKKKYELQFKKADTAIAELEYKIAERLEDIERMKDHIKLQKELMGEIQEKLKGGAS